MSRQHYYPSYPYGYSMPNRSLIEQGRQERSAGELNTILDAVQTGALVGAAGAGAAQLHRLHNHEITWQEALIGTVKGAATTGIATAAAASVGHLVKDNRTLSLATALTTATAVMYALTAVRKKPATEEPADE